jgi:hypothetical protein
MATPNPHDYETDIVAWSRAQARWLKAGRFDRLDLEHKVVSFGQSSRFSNRSSRTGGGSMRGVRLAGREHRSDRRSGQSSPIATPISRRISASCGSVICEEVGVIRCFEVVVT